MRQPNKKPPFSPRWQQRQRSLVPRIQNALLLNQALEVVHLHQARSRANIEAQRVDERIKSGDVSGRLQRASLGTLEDAEAAGLLDPSKGYFVGLLSGSPFFIPRSHTAVMGPTGKGKGTTLAIPNIILDGGRSSTVCLDLKDGELSWTTAEGRAQLDGVDPAFINPWGVHGWPNCRVNPFQDVIDAARDGRKTVDLAATKVRMFFGDTSRFGTNAWIKDDASKVSWMRIVKDAFDDPGCCNPSSLWDTGFWTFPDFVAYCEDAQHSPAGDGFVATVARALLDRYGEEMSDQLGWVLDAVASTFALYGKGSVVRPSVEASDMDLRLLKQRPQAVYVMMPDDHAQSHGDYIAHQLAYIYQAMATPGPVPVTIMADEFANFPRVDATLTVLRLFLSKGVNLWTFVQDRSGFDAYKERGGHKPFEANSTRIVFGVDDAAHAKDIEAIAGYNAVSVPGMNTSAGVTAPGAGQTVGEQVTPVLPASQVTQLSDRKAIVMMSGEKVYIIDRLPWWEMPHLREHVRDKFKTPPPPYEPV